MVRPNSEPFLTTKMASEKCVPIALFSPLSDPSFELLLDFLRPTLHLYFNKFITILNNITILRMKRIFEKGCEFD